MSPKKAAEIIGCTVAHVRRLIRRGKLKAKKTLGPFGLDCKNRVHYVYSISLPEAKRYRDLPQHRGRPRSKLQEQTSEKDDCR